MKNQLICKRCGGSDFESLDIVAYGKLAGAVRQCKNCKAVISDGGNLFDIFGGYLERAKKGKNKYLKSNVAKRK